MISSPPFTDTGAGFTTCLIAGEIAEGFNTSDTPTDCMLFLFSM